jgi:restriction system protein
MARDPKTMTPVEFELSVKAHLDMEGCILKDFRTEHLETLSGTDGDYEMDVTARFEAIGVDFLVVIECKRYGAKPVERMEVQALQQKKLSVGAHKAIIYTTSRFRSGAVKFAKAHGIALVRVLADETNVIVKSWSPGYRSETTMPEDRSLADFLYDGNIPPQVSVVYPSKEAEVIAWRIDVLRGQIDYVRVLASRGLVHPHLTIEQLRADVSELEGKFSGLMDDQP